MKIYKSIQICLIISSTIWKSRQICEGVNMYEICKYMLGEDKNSHKIKNREYFIYLIFDKFVKMEILTEFLYKLLQNL